MVAAMPLSPSAMARRAFWSRLYAGRRLGTERAHALAPLHYALVGERRGYRPNGFFAPDFFRKSAGLSPRAAGLMERYLARDDPDAPSPSAEFDHAWYASQNPDWSRTHPHPFLHFLEVGLQTGRRPRADIDMAFVRDVIRGKGKSIEEAALRVFDPKPRDGDMKPPLSAKELKARQDRFYAEASMRIEKEPKDRGRKLLVYVQSGRGFDAAYLGEPRDYDVLLNYYQDGEPNPRADAVVFQAGTKTTAIRRLLDERPDLILRYEAAIFLDDDVEIGSGQIDRLFLTMAEEKLDLAQPALTADSDFGLAVPQEACGRRGNLQDIDDRDHGADADPPRAQTSGLGLLRVGQRLGNRPFARTRGAGGVRTRQPWRRRPGRGQARAAGRHTRRRLLRLPAPLRHRPRP